MVVRNNENGSEHETFEASQGWFERLKVRANLHCITRKGEAASADIIAAERLPTELKTLIHEGAMIRKKSLMLTRLGYFGTST